MIERALRIAIVNWNRRKIAGTESYLSGVIPELDRLGHRLAFWYERDDSTNHERIELPDNSPTWSVAELGREVALGALREWRPDLIYSHGLADPTLEAAAIGIAPSVFFAHNYYGTCISGAKTFKSPTIVPCDRRFGPRCLLHFYPHRCGGLNPVTMWEQYRLQSKRLEVLRRYHAIIVFSEHMRREYANHGFAPYLAYDFSDHSRSDETNSLALADLSVGNSGIEDSEPEPHARSYWQIVFLGRMEFVKGGRIFLDSLSYLNAEVDRPLRIVFAGDGPERGAWEYQAEKLRRRFERLTIDFRGWLNGSDVSRLLADSDLLVLPSLWPEPFGLAGIEAGRHGVPVAAYAVGGIPYWLTDGLNGHLATGTPPTAAGLAQAISKCLKDPVAHSKLRRGAIQASTRFKLQDHVRELNKIFESVAAGQIRG